MFARILSIFLFLPTFATYAVQCTDIFPGPQSFTTNSVDSIESGVTCNGASCSPGSFTSASYSYSSTSNFNESTIVGGTIYAKNSWNTSEGATVTFSGTGTAIIYIKNDATIRKGVNINKGGDPANVLLIFNKKLKIEENAEINAFIYVNGSETNIEKNSTIEGGIAAKTKLILKENSTYTYDSSDASNLDASSFCDATPVATIDHFEIVHDGSGSTCATESVTIKACADAACSSNYTGEVSLDFLSGGTTRNSPTFTGSITFDFPHLSTGTAALTVTNESVTPDNSTECDSGSGTSCNITYSDSGCDNSCFAYFPDSVQGHDASSYIKFKNTGQVVSDNDNFVTFPSVTDETADSHNTCSSADCAVTGTIAQALSLPTFTTTSSTTDVSPSGTVSIGPGGDYAITEVRNLTVNSVDEVTFLATASEYIIDDALFTGSAKVTFNAGTYWFNELEILESTQVTINGPVTIYVNGQANHFDIEDDAKINQGGAAKDLALVSYKQIHLKNNAIVNAVLYSAGQDIQIKDQAQHTGAISVYGKLEIKDTGKTTFEDVSDVQIGALCGATPATLELSFQFNEGSGQTTADASGNGLTGTLGTSTSVESNDPTWGCEASGYQMTFDGSNNEDVRTSSFTPPSEGTVAFWLKVPALPSSRQRVFGFGDGWELRWDSDDIMYFDINKTGSNSSIRSSSAITAVDTWMHIAFITNADDDTWSLYIDGVLDNSGSETLTSQSASSLTVGGSTWRQTSEHFTGSLDDFRIYSGSLTQAEITTLAATPPVDCAPAIHHYEIEHDGNGLTCSAESVTIKACTNNDCSTLSTDSVTLNFQGDGATISTPTFTGSTSFNFNHTTPEVLTLSVDSPSITPDNNLVCDNISGGSSCDITFADAGFIFSSTSSTNTDIGNQVAGSPFTAYIRAVENVNGVCTGLFNGNVTVGLSQENKLPSGTTGLSFTLDDSSSTTQSLAKHASYSNISLAFNGASEAQLTNATYLDAGQIQLHASYSAGGVNLVGSSNTFWVSPDKLITSAKSGGSDINGNSSSSTTIHKAGAAFDFTVTAQNSLGATTLNYTPNDIQLLLTRTGPIAGVDGSFNYGNGNLTSALAPTYQSVTLSAFSSGVSSTSSASFAEVGLLSLDLQDVDYGFSSNTIAGDVINIGRFYPDHFDVVITNNAFGDTCTSGATDFTYIGQPFSYLNEPVLTITAKNTAGATTQNYTEDGYQKLADTDVSRTFPVEDTGKDGADNATKMVVTPTVTDGSLTTPVSAPASALGVMTYTFNPSDSFTYAKNSNAQVGEFTMDYDIVIDSIQDSDGVNAATSLALSMPTSNTVSPTGTFLRFGRWNIENTFGSERADLTFPMAIQYYNGTSFITNTSDTCTAYDGDDDANHTLSLNNLPNPLSATNLTPISGLGAFALGLAELQIAKPSDGSQGQIRITYDDTPSWLQYDWSWNGSDPLDFTENPSAIATFGLFRGNDRIIYQREVNN